MSMSPTPSSTGPRPAWSTPCLTSLPATRGRGSWPSDNESSHLMIDIASGHPAIDRYLAESYERVRGMSSRFAAAICGHLIRRQSALGIGGELVEIGTFEGRFFIVMALGLAPGEKAL